MTIERDDNDGLNYVIMNDEEYEALDAAHVITSVIGYSSFQGENDAQSVVEYVSKSGLHQYSIPNELEGRLASEMPRIAAMVSDFAHDGIQYVNVNGEGTYIMRVVDYVSLLVSVCKHE